MVSVSAGDLISDTWDINAVAAHNQLWYEWSHSQTYSLGTRPSRGSGTETTKHIAVNIHDYYVAVLGWIA